MLLLLGWVGIHNTETFSGEMSLSAATLSMNKICRVVSEPVRLMKEQTKVT